MRRTTQAKFGRCCGADALITLRIISMRACVADLADGRVFHRFNAERPAVLGASNNDSRPAILVQPGTWHAERLAYCVGFDGSVTYLGPARSVHLSAPGG